MDKKNLMKTPLHPLYLETPGVRLVDFGGWDMPVQFAEGILAEHRAVREEAGLFDVSHMGEILVRGDDAEAFLDYLLPNRIEKAGEGRCIYTPMCREDGGTVDDLLVYVLTGGEYLLVVNAANTDKDFQWISDVLSSTDFHVEVDNRSAEWAQLALQGPESLRILAPHCRGFNPGGT